MALFCDVAIDRNDEGKRQIVTMDYERGGSNKSEQEKRVEVISYLFELAYDLAISDQHNVSESESFESCIRGR